MQDILNSGPSRSVEYLAFSACHLNCCVIYVEYSFTFLHPTAFHFSLPPSHTLCVVFVITWSVALPCSLFRRAGTCVLEPSERDLARLVAQTNAVCSGPQMFLWDPRDCRKMRSLSVHDSADAPHYHQPACKIIVNVIHKHYYYGLTG